MTSALSDSDVDSAWPVTLRLSVPVPSSLSVRVLLWAGASYAYAGAGANPQARPTTAAIRTANRAADLLHAMCTMMFSVLEHAATSADAYS